jgi:predicted RNase H-like HicB family nuclease
MGGEGEGQMSVRMGAPLWWLAAAVGMTIKIRVDVRRDEEAGVYVGISRDLKGLVVEAPTMDELIAEIRLAAQALLEERNSPAKASTAVIEFDTPLCAA